MAVKSPITGTLQKTCEVYKCKLVAYKAWGGFVLCRKHYKETLIKNYGSLKKASKYVH